MGSVVVLYLQSTGCGDKTLIIRLPKGTSYYTLGRSRFFLQMLLHVQELRTGERVMIKKQM